MTKFIFILVLILAASSGFANEERRIDLTWDETKHAVRYEVELYTQGASEVLKSYTFRSHIFSITLPIGVYSIRARAFDKRKVAGPWSGLSQIEVPPVQVKLLQKPPSSTVAEATTLKSSALISWQKSIGADKYLIEIKNTNGEAVDSKTIEENEFKLELPPGQYSVSVTAIGGEQSLKSEAATIKSIKVVGAVLSPIHFSEADFFDGKTVSWKSSNATAEFDVVLERSDIDTRVWYVLEEIEGLTDSSFDLDPKLPPGRYRVRIKARATGWSSSRPVEKEFLIKPSLRAISSIGEKSSK